MCQKRKGKVHKIKMGGPLSEEKSKLKETVLGIVAHVDAGKTTLSENFLYFGGSIRKLGRVDKRDTFLIRKIWKESVELLFFKTGKFCCRQYKSHPVRHSRTYGFFGRNGKNITGT